MDSAVADRPMAGEQTDSKTVRISKAAYEAAKKVATLKGMDLGAYISAVVLPIAKKDLRVEVKKLNMDD